MSKGSNRERIMDAALELFSKKGYDGTSVEEIATECGLKAPNLYRYFKSKEEIFECIDSMIEDQYRSTMGMGLRSMLWIHNAEELKTFSMHQITYTLTDERVIRVRKMITIEQFRNEFLSRKSSEHQPSFMLKQYTGIFAELIKNGEIPEEDSEMLALEYVSPVSLMIQICDREPDRKEEILKKIERYIDYFIGIHFVKKP
ncbi:MAG: TetR/AcrR family transcriptional regulator [Lachnospiraceae bacterium]|nr:TetR/AcrR family transcriptional regulator [Lachnospiraceae bacterium]